MKIQDLESRVDGVCAEIKLLGEMGESYKKQLVKLQARLQKIESYEILVSQAVAVLDVLKEKKERASKGVVEDLVSYGLNAIFGEDQPFRITLETKQKSVYAYLGLGEEKQDLIRSKGGGYIDLISVLTVLTLLLKEKPGLQRFIVLDESFSEIGREHLDKVGEFLRFLVTKLDLTILLVTHQVELLEFADKVYRVDKKPGQYTTFEEIKNG